jgi:hypothetical protein
MAIEAGPYINSLVAGNPPNSDPVSQGAAHLRLIKETIKQSLPSVNQGSNPVITNDSAPTQIIADDVVASGSKGSQGLVWYDTTTDTLKINKSTTATADWVTLAISPITSNSVDINAGAVDGAVIGGATPAAITGTTLTGNTSLALATGATVTGVDNGSLGASATLLATQGAIKTYVDAQVTAQDLDISTDSGGPIAIDLDSETLAISGGEGIDTSSTGNTVTIAGEDASTSNKGVASFSSDHFSVSSGAVTIATDGIDDTLIDFGTGTNQVSTADVPEQTNLYYTNVRADARIAAADIGDLSNVDITSIANDEVLRYDETSGTWENVASEYPDQLTTRGDLVAYNSGSDPAAEERFPMPAGADDKILTSNASAEFGFEWVKVATASIADDAVGASQLANTSVTANTYAYPTEIIVDAQGRLTSATAGTASASKGFSVAMAIAL